MARVGYARVSSRDQNLDSQLDMLTVAGCEKIFEDKISGVKESRPEWDRLLELAGELFSTIFKRPEVQAPGGNNICQ